MGYNTSANRGADTFSPFKNGIESTSSQSAWATKGTYTIQHTATRNGDYGYFGFIVNEQLGNSNMGTFKVQLHVNDTLIKEATATSYTYTSIDGKITCNKGDVITMTAYASSRSLLYYIGIVK